MRLFNSRERHGALTIVGLRAQAGITSLTEKVPEGEGKEEEEEEAEEEEERRRSGVFRVLQIDARRNKQGDTLIGRRLWREATGICN